MNNQFELLEFVLDSIFLDLLYDGISFISTVGNMSIVMWSSLVCL